MLIGAQQRRVPGKVVGPMAGEAPAPLLAQRPAQCLDDAMPAGSGVVGNLRRPEGEKAGQVAGPVIVVAIRRLCNLDPDRGAAGTGALPRMPCRKRPVSGDKGPFLAKLWLFAQRT